MNEIINKIDDITRTVNYSKRRTKIRHTAVELLSELIRVYTVFQQTLEEKNRLYNENKTLKEQVRELTERTKILSKN